MTADRSPLQADSDNLWQQHRLRGVDGRGGAVVEGAGLEWRGGEVEGGWRGGGEVGVEVRRGGRGEERGWSGGDGQWRG